MTPESQPPYAPPRAFLEVPEAPEGTPRQVIRAINLLWASFVLGLIETGLNLTFDPKVADDVGPVLFLTVLMTALYAFVILSASKRKNWARILLLIGVLMTPAYLLYPWDLPDPWWETALFAVSFAIEVIAMFWLFSGAGAIWYARKQDA
jgi:hypothetical protein